ncbi:MAG: class I SAM-dependent methyltransferase [Acidimicrobiales bacterium]
MAEALRALYENPQTTVRSGAQRSALQAAMLARVLGGCAAGATVVDVGCGDGTASLQALDVCRSSAGGPRLVGLDWSAAAADQARSVGVTVACCSSGNLPLADDSVDVVIMGEVIEHLIDTDGALIEARRVVRPGGWLLLSTPNLAAWYNRVLLALGIQPVFSEVSLRRIYGRPGSEVVGHLRLFTKRALVGLVKANGFSNVRVAGAPYHDVPQLVRSLDRVMCKLPDLASILLLEAQVPLTG